MEKTETVFIQGDNMRIFEIRGAPIIDLNREGEGLSLKDVEFNFGFPVHVFSDDDESTSIGSASFYQKDNKIFADIFLNYGSTIRLDLEAGNAIYPQAECVVETVGDGVPTEMLIESLTLTRVGQLSETKLNDYVFGEVK